MRNPKRGGQGGGRGISSASRRSIHPVFWEGACLIRHARVSSHPFLKLKNVFVWLSSLSNISRIAIAQEATSRPPPLGATPLAVPARHRAHRTAPRVDHDGLHLRLRRLRPPHRALRAPRVRLPSVPRAAPAPPPRATRLPSRRASSATAEKVDRRAGRERSPRSRVPPPSSRGTRARVGAAPAAREIARRAPERPAERPTARRLTRSLPSLPSLSPGTGGPRLEIPRVALNCLPARSARGLARTLAARS